MPPVRKYGAVKNATYVMREMFHKYPFAKWQIPVRIVIDVLLPFLNTVMFAYTINLIINGASPSEFMIFVGLFIAGLFVLRGIQRYVTDWTNETYSWVRFINYGQCLIDKAITTDYSNIEPQHKQREMEKASSAMNASNNIQAMARVVPNMMVNVLGIITYAFAIIVLDFRILLVLLVVCIVNTLLNRFANRWLEKLRDEDAAINRKTKYIHEMSVELENGKDIRLYQMKRWIVNALSGLIRKRKSHQIKTEGIRAIPGVSDIFLIAVRDSVMYLILAFQVLDGSISLPMFTMYIGLVSNFSNWIYALVSNYSTLQQASFRIDDYRNIVEMEDGVGVASANDASVSDTEYGVDIEFDNVSFKYHGAEKNVLENLSFKIKKGEKIALVGNNGAGKTTIVKLLCGFYRPTAGTIKINGRNVNTYTLNEYYKLIGAVFQDILPLSFTIAQNISGRSLEETDLVKVKECIELAGLKDKMAELENKELTFITNRLDKKGTQLSGGETQKLMLARVLYKSAPVLILDEPTSAMDAISESQMYENYDQFTKGKTSIFITHRIASTRFCDRIFFLENGAIEETGTHDKLVALPNGKYANMFHLQGFHYNQNNDKDNDNE